MTHGGTNVQYCIFCVEVLSLARLGCCRGRDLHPQCVPKNSCILWGGEVDDVDYRSILVFLAEAVQKNMATMCCMMWPDCGLCQDREKKSKQP